MTALAGYWGLGDNGDHRRACAAMLKSQAVYGQHAAQWADADIALGRRLYPTLPEDAFDRGPVTTPSGRVLLGDVRLDNRGELTRAVNADGSRLSDTSLTALVLERWGVGGFDRLVGDYALAWWDPNRGELALARDQAGQRPLHYHRGRGFIAFASMPKGLHALPQIPRESDELLLAATLSGAVADGPATLFKNILRIQPGEVLLLRADGSAVSRFWAPDLSPLRLAKRSDYAEALREKLDDAVAARLRGAGAEVASHLSGGLDSGAVAVTAARLMAPRRGKVVAFTAVPRAGCGSAVPSSRIADEGPLAAATAAAYPNIEHVLVQTPSAVLPDTPDRRFFLAEQPAAVPVNVGWQEEIKRQARQRRMSVLLVGQMGNFTLTYAGDGLLAELARRGSLLQLVREAAGMRRSGINWGGILADAIAPLLPDVAWRLISRLRGVPADTSGYSLIRKDVQEQLQSQGLRPEMLGRWTRDAARRRIEWFRRADPGNNRKATLAGWGLDVRDPTSDRRLVELSLRIPLSVWQQEGVRRALANEALADRLPRIVLDEQRRGYQAAGWFEDLQLARSELLAEVERAEASPEVRAILDVSAMRALVAALPERQPSDADTARLYRVALLRSLAASDFLRRAAGRND